MEINPIITIMGIIKSNDGSSLKTINGKSLLSIHVNISRTAHHAQKCIVWMEINSNNRNGLNNQ